MDKAKYGTNCIQNLFLGNIKSSTGGIIVIGRIRLKYIEGNQVIRM
jgi:hypothetical protein